MLHIKFIIIKVYDGSEAVLTFVKYNKSNKEDSLRPIDIIFIDCEMPILNGFDAVK